MIYTLQLGISDGRDIICKLSKQVIVETVSVSEDNISRDEFNNVVDFLESQIETTLDSLFDKGVK